VTKTYHVDVDLYEERHLVNTFNQHSKLSCLSVSFASRGKTILEDYSAHW